MVLPTLPTGSAAGARAHANSRSCATARIGTYGALALVLSLAIRVAAITSLERPIAVAAGLVVAATTGRAAIVLLLTMLLPARDDGMAASLGRRNTSGAFAGMAIAAVACFVLVPGGAAATVILGATITAVAIAATARVQLGGYTGDVLGAVEQITECVVLSLLAAALQR